MSNFYDEKDGVFEVGGGCIIDSTIAEGIGIARGRGRDVVFEFNGVTVAVRGDSDAALIYRDWNRALNGYIDKRVGPYPAAVLSESERANDARVEAENQARRDAAQAEYDARMATRSSVVAAKLANDPGLELADVEAWETFKATNTDPYGAGVVAYAEQWARLMQVELAAGRKLEDVADTASREADTEGITGFMYGCAVGVLAKCWKHGEELRRWHNLKTQLRDEGERANESGGVLNPALLNFG